MHIASTKDYQNLIREVILDDECFVNAIFSGHQHGRGARWKKVVVRPILIKQRRHLQFSYFDEQKDITKNYAGEEILQRLNELLHESFANFVIVTRNERIQINLSKKGTARISRNVIEIPIETTLTHDRQKKKILQDGQAIRYLQLLGIMTDEGQVKAGMYSKFTQINEFLRLLAETKQLDKIDHRPIQVIDFGCGNAYLTFATYHYLTEILGLQTRMAGIDIKSDLLAKHAEKARELGWDGLSFEKSLISEYSLLAQPDIVIALHACDTATDDAIAQGIRAHSRIILCAPCCQHHLQVQLTRSVPATFASVMSFGLLHERLGDILTDAFRALILRIMGYRVDLLQFVPAEHTPKNLMIRAVKVAPQGHAKNMADYLELKRYWNVTPYLHQLLQKELDALMPPC